VDPARQFSLAVDAGFYRQQENDRAGLEEVRQEIVSILERLEDEADAEPLQAFSDRLRDLVPRYRGTAERLFGPLPQSPTPKSWAAYWRSMLVLARRERTRAHRFLARVRSRVHRVLEEIREFLNPNPGAMA
jgi:hypothetical protein